MNQRPFDEPNDIWGESSNNPIWNDLDESEIAPAPKSIHVRLKISPKVITVIVVSLLALILLPKLISGTSSVDKTPNGQPANLTPSTPTSTSSVDLYSQPKLQQSFIDTALASAVTIVCADHSGSGWTIDLSDDPTTSTDDQYPTEIVTNHHVIAGCENSSVTIQPMGTQDVYEAFVYSYDTENDLAILMTDKSLPAFPTLTPENKPRVGQWVMAIGSPGTGSTTLNGSITTGHITNFQDTYVVTDTTINPGNSGGPLLNSAGQVVAVVTAKIVDTKINNIGFAQEASLVCVMLDGCTKKKILK